MFGSNAYQVGYPQLGATQQNDATSPALRPGTLIAAVDSHWGMGEFLYCKANGAIRARGLCVITPTFDSTLGGWQYEVTEVPNTANLGRSLAVNIGGVMADGDYGWFQVSGVTPVNCSAAVAADTTFGIAAAGQGGANSAGKQVLNARICGASTTTVVRPGVAANGSTKLVVDSADGWFIGAYLSGTGIAAGTTVAAIAPDNRTVTLSAATSAAVNGDVTATYNNATVYYNVAMLNRAFAQGAIT